MVMSSDPPQDSEATVKESLTTPEPELVEGRQAWENFENLAAKVLRTPKEDAPESSSEASSAPSQKDDEKGS